MVVDHTKTSGELKAAVGDAAALFALHASAFSATTPARDHMREIAVSVCRRLGGAVIAVVGKAYLGTNTDTSCGVANYTDTEVNSVCALTNDTTLLKRRIDKLDTAGSTAGHLGTAWAWYLLSPKLELRAAAGLSVHVCGRALWRPDDHELARPA